MRSPLFQLALTVGFLAGCAGSTIKPAELLDDWTGATVGALQEPIELVESAQSAAPAAGKRTSFAYLGPVEWDRSGDINYGLWIHVAPGNDRQVGDIRAPGAVTLNLDAGPLVLSPIEAPPVGREPYQPVASWGQTGYFALDAALLKRIAASEKLSLEFRVVGESSVEFIPSHSTRATLLQFERARGITVD